MINVGYSFSAADNAWVTNQINLKEGIDLRINLTSNGRVVIKKKNSAGGTFCKVYISRVNAKNLVIPIKGCVEGKIIKVYCETEPSQITIMGDATVSSL